MPGIEINFRSRVRGDISSGAIHRHVAAYEHDVAEAIADEGQDAVLRRLGNVLRTRTPYYETQIDTRELTPTRYEVHDSGVIYGHWLEGTGSMNAPRTIFPGYHSFEFAEVELRKKRSAIGRQILRQYRSRGLLK